MKPNFLCASFFAGPLFFMGCFTFVVGMAFFYYYSGKLFFSQIFHVTSFYIVRII